MKAKITSAFGDPTDYTGRIDELEVIQIVESTEEEHGFVIAEIKSLTDLAAIARTNDSSGSFGWHDDITKKRIVLAFGNDDEMMEVEIYNGHRE